TPLDWALEGAGEPPAPGFTGDYAGTVETLIQAGASLEDVEIPPGNRAVAEVLRRHGVRD
ncbi:MAG: hypothetical protein ACE5F1_23230, partial [Planctomycetota bacterium]